MIKSVWEWHTLITPGFGRLRQEDYDDFKASLGYLVKPCLKQNKIKVKKISLDLRVEERQRM